MSILASLVRAYDRLPDAPPFGFSEEKISFLISLDESGKVVGLPHDLRGEDKKRTPRLLPVPAAFKRPGVTPRPFFLWDNAAFVLGVTGTEGKDAALRHRVFRDYHSEVLSGTDDPGLCALAAFLASWAPDRFVDLGWPEEMKDQNVIFGLESQRRDRIFLHDRPAAKALWARLSAAGDKTEAICLVTGEPAPVARLHPAIKGVWGAQSSGASIVSFNLDAFTSYGHDQGDNAQVSEAAAFAYTTALNRFLERESGHRIQIGDASTVFWADASGADKALADKKAREAEELFADWFEGPPPDTRIDEKTQAAEVGTKLTQIKAGEPLSKVAPDLAEGVRFYVLGLAPNAARLSIRFYYDNDFGVLAENYRRYLEDTRLEPRPSSAKPTSISRMVARTAPARRDSKGKLSFDLDRASPLLSGELLRAILTGDNFPNSLLPLLLMRIRADHHLDSVRVGLLKGLIVRPLRKAGKLPKRADGTIQEDYLVRSDPNDPNPARRLGRLFALIERTQLASLGDEVNVTVKDKYLGAAAATPAQVFVSIHDNAQHHLKRLRNGHSDAKWIKDAQQARRVSAGLQRDIGRIWATFNDGLPAQHSTDEQAFFLVGYYQERFGGKADAETGDPDVAPEINDQGEE